MRADVPPSATVDSPQPVETWYESGWRAGLLVGCRLAPDGLPLAWVWLPEPEAVALWIAFSNLRLPPPAPTGRHRAPVDRAQCEPAPGPATVRLPLSRVSLPRQRCAPAGPGRWSAGEPLTAPLW